MELENQIVLKTILSDPEVTYDDDTASNKSTELPQLLVQVEIFL